MSEGDVENIQGDLQYPSPKEKAFQVLKRWYDQGRSSTYGELGRALQVLGKHRVVEKHCLADKDKFVDSKRAGKSGGTFFKKVRLQIN